MRKVYKVVNDISKQEYKKVFPKYLRQIEGTFIYIIVVFTMAFMTINGELASTGDRTIDIILSVGPAIFIIGFYITYEYKKFLKGYKQGQTIVFSEEGIRDEDDALYIHWVNLRKTYRSKNVLLIRQSMFKFFVIKISQLSGEQKHFLNKRLRGIEL